MTAASSEESTGFSQTSEENLDLLSELQAALLAAESHGWRDDGDAQATNASAELPEPAGLPVHFDGTVQSRIEDIDAMFESLCGESAVPAETKHEADMDNLLAQFFLETLDPGASSEACQTGPGSR